MFCNDCGHRNAQGSNFCSSCGAALVPPDGDPASTTMQLETVEAIGEARGDAARDGRVAVLVIAGGRNAGARFPLESEFVTAGRHPVSDIFLDDVTVSRRHVELTRQPDGAYVIRDVGSLNGTYLNRERIEEAELSSGDELQIGKFRLVYLDGGRTGAEPS